MNVKEFITTSIGGDSVEGFYIKTKEEFFEADGLISAFKELYGLASLKKIYDFIFKDDDKKVFELLKGALQSYKFNKKDKFIKVFEIPHDGYGKVDYIEKIKIEFDINKPVIIIRGQIKEFQPSHEIAIIEDRIKDLALLYSVIASFDEDDIVSAIDNYEHAIIDTEGEISE